MSDLITRKKLNEVYREFEQQIKLILVNQAFRFKVFPLMSIGLLDKKYQRSNCRGIAYELPAIMIDEKRQSFDSQCAVMFQDGLYIMRTDLFEVSSSNLVRIPDFSTRYEGGYAQYGMQAYGKMERLLDEMEKNSKPKRR